MLRLHFVILCLIGYCMCLTQQVWGQEEGRWWGYCQTDDALTGFNTGQIEDYSCAIFVEGDRGAGMGRSFSAVRIALQGCQSLENLKVWLSASLPKEASKATLLTLDVDAKQMTDGEFYEIELPKAYAIGKKGLYVGYSFETPSDAKGVAKKPVLSTKGVPSQPNGFFLKSSISYTDWMDLQPYNRGNLAVQLLLNGEFVENGVSVESFDEVVTTAGQAAVVPIVLRNRGVNGVKSIDYTLCCDGEPYSTEHLVLPEPVEAVNDVFTLQPTFAARQTAGMTRLSIEVEKVNDVDNEVVEGAAKAGALITLEQSARHRVLMEECTGTWCMWCPRGAVAIEHLLEDYPDRFVAVAIHCNDVMEIASYWGVKSCITGLPGCMLDRDVTCDPFEGTQPSSYGIHYDVEERMEALCPADVMVQAQWSDADSMQISVRTDVTLQYDRDDDPPYRLAYVLLADSLCGESNEWTQKNGFAGSSFTDYSQDPYLAPLTEYGQFIQDYVYNDVAVAAFGVDTGLEGSVCGPFVGGIGCAHEYRIDLKGNPLVQNKRNLKVVAMLLSEVDGRVVNCHCAAVQGVVPAVLTVVGREVGSAPRRYTLDGRLCAPGYRGLSVIVK